jgi:7,8-dihydropterin-6-yl-methyl-4-(beta-D-ribofuranosyl)aminobenzene 5'-phosphate synthase
LQKTFGDRFLYAGVGTVLPLSAGPGARTLRGEAAILAGDDLAAYREFARWSHDAMDFKFAQADRDHAH